MRILSILLLVVLILALVFVRTSLIKVAPGEIGVRTLNFGASKGIVQRDYGPGYHRNLWPLDTWNVFPSTAQRLRFVKDELGLARDGSDASSRPVGEMELKSAGGDRVAMGVEVVFRIADGQACRVLQDSGPERRYEEVVRNITQDATRTAFGGLITEDFYKHASREEARQKAFKLLAERLKLRGIELIDLLVQTIEFDPNYESKIKQKKLADQQVELEKAKAKAAEETGKVAKIKAETAAKVQKVDREAEAEETRLRTEAGLQAAAMAGEARKYEVQKLADGELYGSEKKAEGERLIKLAEAEGTLRLNAALAGEGGRNLVAVQAAKSLNLSEVTFPSVGYEWLNPYEMASRLGGTPTGGVPTTAPAAASAFSHTGETTVSQAPAGR